MSMAGFAGDGAFMGLLNSTYAARVCRLPYTTFRMLGAIVVGDLHVMSMSFLFPHIHIYS